MQGLSPPNNIAVLKDRVSQISGLTLGQCASALNIPVPDSQLKQKGWVGSLMEKALGADALNLPIPDFSELGVELKTLPIGKNGKPSESTFISSISLTGIAKETWETSQVRKKLSHVLWVPVEDLQGLPLSHQRIGQGFLWQPSVKEESILKRDWLELSELIIFGRFEDITARLGTALQIRPKAATGKVLRQAIGEEGTMIKTLPRGFYLRSAFTARLLPQ